MRSAPMALGCCLLAAAGWYGLAGRAENSGGAPSVFPCTVASITDGDTFTCSEIGPYGRSIRVRLAGVDAREAGDYCAPNHPCASAHADEATAELSRLALGQRLQCQANGSTYRRIAAYCSLPDGRDLSCLMLQGGFVAIWPRYWRGHSC